jgi:hypothetical protein
MSVATLFARLDELVTGIDRQKEILTNMELTKRPWVDLDRTLQRLILDLVQTSLPLRTIEECFSLIPTLPHISN